MEINYVSSTEGRVIHITEIFLWQVEQIKIQMDCASPKQFLSISQKNLLKIIGRPRNLLVFVNSICGNQDSKKIYGKEVLPIFEQWKTNVKTIWAERRNHARDYIKENSFAEYDEIIGVGCDGIFSEISFSVFSKTIEERHLNLNGGNIY